VVKKNDAQTRHFLVKDRLREKKVITPNEILKMVEVKKEIPNEVEKETVECAKDEYLETLEISLTEDDISTIVGNVRKFLTETERASCKVNKAQVALKIFRYLSEPKCCKFIKDNQTFGTMVLNKMQELKKDFKGIPQYNAQFEMSSETILRRIERNGLLK